MLDVDLNKVMVKGGDDGGCCRDGGTDEAETESLGEHVDVWGRWGRGGPGQLRQRDAQHQEKQRYPADY